MKMPMLRYLGVALVATFFTSCSSIGTVVVTEVGGQPCFAVQKKWATRNGIPLYGLSVSKKGEIGDRADVWMFSVEPPGKSIVTRPDSCIRYGLVPALATQGALEPLQPYQIYHVMMNARPHDSNVMGYIAEFCVKPAANGRTRVQPIPWDEAAAKWRYDLCDRPA